MLKHKNLRLFWHGHAAFRLENDSRLYFDPFRLNDDAPPADLVLISHEHFDHLSLSDLKKIVSYGTTVVAPPICQTELKKLRHEDIHYLSVGQRLDIQDVAITAVPAYNLNKFRAPGLAFHPRQDGKVGYVVRIGDVTCYHAGDTDAIPEMKNLENIDIALLPVSGTYVMTSEEAVQAVDMIKPKIAVPMHWGSIVGSRADAEHFEQQAREQAQIVIM